MLALQLLNHKWWQNTTSITLVLKFFYRVKANILYVMKAIHYEWKKCQIPSWIVQRVRVNAWRHPICLDVTNNLQREWCGSLVSWGDKHVTTLGPKAVTSQDDQTQTHTALMWGEAYYTLEVASSSPLRAPRRCGSKHTHTHTSICCLCWSCTDPC